MTLFHPEFLICAQVSFPMTEDTTKFSPLRKNLAVTHELHSTSVDFKCRQDVRADSGTSIVAALE